MFIQINMDNQLKSDADANDRLEENVRNKLNRFEQRLTHVEIHVSDVNGPRGGHTDKSVSLEARPTGHSPIAVHAEGARIEDAVSNAAGKAARALDSLFGKLCDRH